MGELRLDSLAHKKYISQLIGVSNTLINNNVISYTYYLYLNIYYTLTYSLYNIQTRTAQIIDIAIRDYINASDACDTCHNICTS